MSRTHQSIFEAPSHGKEGDFNKWGAQPMQPLERFEAALGRARVRALEQQRIDEAIQQLGADRVLGSALREHPPGLAVAVVATITQCARVAGYDPQRCRAGWDQWGDEIRDARSEKTTQLADAHNAYDARRCEGSIGLKMRVA